ncbi:MAG TPA: hypothetical protein VLF95_06850 [Vicinamibacteria bacterium]|nr:hypothetical protein [Vicinamibacteria bacterium]
MNCPHCGGALVCGACGTAIEPRARGVPGEALEPGAAEDPEEGDVSRASQTFLVVARGHGDLLEQLQEVVGDLGWVTLIKDRRGDPTILPREGREGTVHVDQDLNP